MLIRGYHFVSIALLPSRCRIGTPAKTAHGSRCICHAAPDRCAPRLGHKSAVRRCEPKPEQARRGRQGQEERNDTRVRFLRPGWRTSTAILRSKINPGARARALGPILRQAGRSRLSRSVRGCVALRRKGLMYVTKAAAPNPRARSAYARGNRLEIVRASGQVTRRVPCKWGLIGRD
jgi:hypothetical protein